MNDAAIQSFLFYRLERLAVVSIELQEENIEVITSNNSAIVEEIYQNKPNVNNTCLAFTSFDVAQKLLDEQFAIVFEVTNERIIAMTTYLSDVAGINLLRSRYHRLSGGF